MDIIGWGILFCLGVIIVGFIVFSVTTKKIIDSQETEIEILKRDNERLKCALSGAKYVKRITTSDKPLTAGYHKAVIEPNNDPFREW